MREIDDDGEDDDTHLSKCAAAIEVFKTLETNHITLCNGVRRD